MTGSQERVAIKQATAVRTAIFTDRMRNAMGRTRYKKRTNSTGPYGKMRKANTISKGTKFLQPALPLIFSSPKRMNGAKKPGP